MTDIVTERLRITLRDPVEVQDLIDELKAALWMSLKTGTRRWAVLKAVEGTVEFAIHVPQGQKGAR